MNEQQTAALWATAFRDLATATTNGRMQIPHSVDIWTHDVELDQLLAVADFTTPEPLPIRITDDGRQATVVVPVGEPLDLRIKWHFFGPVDSPDDVRKINEHNDQCVAGIDITHA